MTETTFWWFSGFMVILGFIVNVTAILYSLRNVESSL